MLRIGGIIVLVLCVYLVSAQEKFAISGRLTDSLGEGLPRATIKFYSKTDTFSIFSKENGEFSARVTNRLFKIEVSMKGYHNVSKNYMIPEGNTSLHLEILKMQTDYQELDPVIVKKAKPLIIGEDTVTYNADAYHVRDGAELEALLKKLPGVEVDMDGNVIVKGKIVSKVLVDGKLFFGGDVLTATRNLPAEIIDKLQVIDDYGEKARMTGIKVGESTKVLNIVLKEDKRSGSFGQLQAAIGNEGKYATELFGNSFRGDRQLGLNNTNSDNSQTGRDPQINISLSYSDRWSSKWKADANPSYYMAHPYSENSIVQDNYYLNGKSHLEQNTQSDGKTQNVNFGMGLTYSPDTYHTLHISPGIKFQNIIQNSSTSFLTIQQDIGSNKNSQGTAINSVKGNVTVKGLQFSYEQMSPESKRRFSISGGAQIGNNDQSTTTMVNTRVQWDSVNSRSSQSYLIHDKSPNYDLAGNINYFYPLGKNGFLELAYYWHNSFSHSTKAAYDLNDPIANPVFVDSLSQDYRYTTANHLIHTGYTSSIGKLNLSVSVDAQPGIISGNTSTKQPYIKYKYFGWLPTFQILYPISASKKFSLSYSGRMQLPTLQQLQPATDVTNPQYPVTGNPFLHSSFSHNVTLHYEQSILKATQYWGFGVNVGYNKTENAILPNIIHPKDSSGIIQSTTYLNGSGPTSYFTDLNLTLPALLKKKLRITLNTSISNNHEIAIADNRSYPIISTVGSQSIHLQYNLPDIAEADLSANYSLNSSTYPSSNSTNTITPYASWTFRNKYYLWHHWILNYTIIQFLSGSPNQGLHPNNVGLTASFQREFFRKNQAMVTITGYNLLNNINGATQSTNPNSTTITKTYLTGRYIMIGFSLKLNHFKE